MRHNLKLRQAATLMATVSAVSLAMPAMAGELLYSSTGQAGFAEGERVTQVQGLTQVRLDNGATVSILDRADYRINADGSVDLYAGGLTVVGGEGVTVVRMPEGVQGEVSGRGSSASFSVGENGEGRGHVLTGSARLGRGGGNQRQFDAGEMFSFAPGERIAQVVSNGAQTTPGSGDAAEAPLVADMGSGGPVAAAVNGLPVTLGDALAAAGASGDVIAAARRVEAGAANPALETFPSGDLGLLVAGAAGLENAYGGTPFTGAQADIIRTYLAFLAEGGQGANFLSSYAGILGQYLDLVRSGGTPSAFGLASLPEINSFITYRDRTGGFGSLAARDRVLLEAYLQFIASGGNADQFAGRFTDLTEAYFAFLRGGGDPLEFGQASQATLNSYIAFLADSGMVQQLGAADRALLEAYLANGGFAFAGQYRTALGAYYDYLAAGRLPSTYTSVDQASLQAWLATLQSTALLDSVLGEQAEFFASYLAYLQGGGSVDGFAGLPANIFAGYSTQLNSYFAFLAAGNLPSEYEGADIAQLQAFVAQLRAAGALEAFLGSRAAFFADFNAFLAGGGNADMFAQLNANIFAGYAQALGSYFAYLNAGGLPSAYSAADVAQINAWLAQLAAAGALERFLGVNAGFFADYFAFVQGGGQIDSYAALNANIFSGYARALAAYYDYLAGGGVPSGYGALSQQTIAAYLAALEAAGASGGFLADLAEFYSG